MESRVNLFLKLSILFNVILIFFGAYLGNLYVLQIIAFALAIVSCNFIKLKVKLDTKLWLLVALICITSIVISIDKQSTVEVASLIIMAIFLKIIYENKNEWQDYFLRLVLIASGVHVVATLLQLIMPDFINIIDSFILSTENLKMNQDLYKVGAYAGITAQTTVNSFYITMFIGLTFFKIMFEKKYMKIRTITLILGIIALFITGKRGLLLFSIVSIVLLFLYISYKDKKNILKYIIAILSIGIIGYFVVMNIPETRLVLERINTVSDTEEALNGRDYLWKETIKVFKENPIIGIGLGSIQNIIGEYSHNVYIQLSAETGIVGVLLYVFAMLSSLCVSIRTARTVLKKGGKNQKVQVIFAIYMQSIFIMYGFTGNPLYGQFFVIPYMIAIAISNSILVKEDNKK